MELQEDGAFGDGARVLEHLENAAGPGLRGHHLADDWVEDQRVRKPSEATAKLKQR